MKINISKKNKYKDPEQQVVALQEEFNVDLLHNK